MKISIVEKLNSSSIVSEVIGTILFFHEEIFHAKKILKKHISKYTLTNTQIKGYYLHFMILMIFKRIISFFMKIYTLTYEEQST